MIRRIVLIFLLISFSTLVFAADEKAAVEAAERAWAKAVVGNDYPSLEKILADDLYYSHSNFLEDTKRDYIDKLKSGKARYYVLDIETLKVWILDDRTALVGAVAEYQTKAPDGSRQTSILKTLHVYRKNDGVWQLTAHQSARKP
ncbi:MAG TPA: nuclear transport factor 2 family protein [Acidobacteriota bacterium]|nr:nuclear transport factor 2 family protein [Acidobacteriota bacterium]